MRVEAAFSFRNLAQHGVETTNQDADLVVTRDGNPGLVIMGSSNLGDRVSQLTKRPGDAALQLPRDEQPDRQSDAGADEIQAQRGEEPVRKSGRVGNNVKSSDVDAAVYDWHRDLDCSVFEQQERRQ